MKGNFNLNGFHKPIGIDGLLVSTDGIVFDIEKQRYLISHVGNHGYPVVKRTEIKDGRKYRKSYLIHRLIAFAFLKFPERYKEVRLSRVQVNHIDGDKLNFNLKNLEFCLAKENMRHAFKNKLIDIGRSVLAKDIRTGDVVKYESVATCVDAFNLSRITLRRHLLSRFSGMKTVEWNVFKYDDGTDWPYIDTKRCIKDSLHITTIFIARNEKEDKTLIFSTIKKGCDYLNLNYNSVKASRKRTRIGALKGWIFTEKDFSEIPRLDSLIFERTKFGRSSERYYIVRSTINGEVIYCHGGQEVSVIVDYEKGYVCSLLSEGKTMIGDYEITPISKEEYQGQTGIRLPTV